MPIQDITTVDECVINAKKDGEPILQTLKKLGVARSTYYKMIAKNGNDRWRKIKQGKMVIKKSSQKIRGCQEAVCHRLQTKTTNYYRTLL